MCMSAPKPPPPPKPVAAPPAPEKPPEVIEDATKKTNVKKRGTKSLRRGKSGLQISKGVMGSGLKIGGIR